MSAPTDYLGEKWKGPFPSSSLILSHLRQRTISFKLVIFTTITTCDSVFIVYLWTVNHHLFWWFTFNSTCRWVLPVSQLLTDWCLLSSSPHLLFWRVSYYKIQTETFVLPFLSVPASKLMEVNRILASCALTQFPLLAWLKLINPCLPKIFWSVCHFSRYVTSTSPLNS